MKKSTLILALLSSLSIIFSIPFVADARGSHAGAGTGGYHSSTTIVEQETVFELSPPVFRKAVKMLKEKYPEYSCGEWKYDYDSQVYFVRCSTKDGIGPPNKGNLRLTMDGYVEFQSQAADGARQKSLILGDWGEFTN